MNDLIKELEAVTFLAEKATPGKWSVVPEVENEFGQSEYAIEVFDGSCPIVGTGSFYGDPHDANECVAAVNFIRTHHARIADALKDARRWRHARTILPVEYIEDSQREFESYGLPVSEEESIAADEAIDAAMHNSAREAGE